MIEHISSICMFVIMKTKIGPQETLGQRYFSQVISSYNYAIQG